MCSNLLGQTCCTAGAPVGNYLGIQHTTEKAFSLQIGYEYNSINLLIDNNSKLENDPRTRSGQNISLKVDYTLNKKIAFSTILPVVQQARSTFSESQASIGVGDLILLTQYSPINNNFNSFNITAGIKIPTGKNNHRGGSNILLSPDMQSGSGSIDFIFRTGYSKSNLFISFLSGYVNTLFKVNGTNDTFGSTATFDGRRFGFGNESISQLGFKYLWTLKKGFLTPDLGIKYRWQDSNVEQNVAAPNSGGNWITIPFGISFAPDNYKSIAFTAELPVYQNLEGLQITTNLRLGLQVNYTFQKNKIDSIIN